MTSSADVGAVADTSFAIPLLLGDHPSHPPCVRAADAYAPALAGHAWYESYSVLTRLDDRRRLSPARAEETLRVSFPTVIWLGSREHARAAHRMVEGRVMGGAVYDALVAAAATTAGLPLLTLDRRAVRTYEAMGAEVIFVD